MADEVAEVPVRDLGDERAARAAQQAATGRPCEITGLGRSVVIHLVRCPQSPDAEAVPGQLKATLDGTVAFRVRAAVNRFILPYSERAALLPLTRGGPSGPLTPWRRSRRWTAPWTAPWIRPEIFGGVGREERALSHQECL
jgi:hypothetical protein